MPAERSTSRSVPNSLDAWVKHLDGIVLPIPTVAHQRARAALSDNRKSLRAIADMMQDSPALVLCLLREANRHSVGIAEPAESLEVAITRLGLSRTEALLERLPIVRSQDIPAALRQLQMIGQHASQQAYGLFGARLARLWPDIHLGSLLFLAPLWPMALAHPGLVEEWELRVVHKGESARKVELELFGVRLVNLCLAVTEAWHLPVWVTQGYRLLLQDQRKLVKALHIAHASSDPLRQQQLLDEDQTLRRWLHQPANTILLANGIALSAQQAWNSPHIVRWELLTGMYVQQPVEDVQQTIHQNAAASARLHAAPGIWHPAEALIWPWDVRRVHRGLLPAPPPSTESLHSWRQHCTELLKVPTPFANAIHLTSFARDALVACGMQRVMLLMLDRKATVLRVHQTAGLDKAASAVVVDVEQNTVLQRLCAQATQLRLTPANNAQFSALLPIKLRGWFKGEHLLLRSLASNDKVVMLVLADQNGGPLSDITVQAFGKTAQCIERALTHFSNRNL